MSLQDVPKQVMPLFYESGGIITNNDLLIFSNGISIAQWEHFAVLFRWDGFRQGGNPELEADQNDKISLKNFVEWIASTTGYIEFDPQDYPELFRELPFPNNNGTVYNVYLTTAGFPEDIRVSPFTGKPYFARFNWLVGRLLDIDNISWDGNELVITLKDQTWDGHTLALKGRKVRVTAFEPSEYIGQPFSAVEEVAIQDLVVEDDNKTIRTNNPFGQDNPSTDPNKYSAVLLGAHIVDGDDGGVLVGKVTGNGPGQVPTQFDLSKQNIYYIDSLWADYASNYPE